MSFPQIPVFDLRLEEDDVQAVLDVYRSGWLTMGPRTAEFERVFAEHLGAKHAVAVSSCTAALHLAYLAAGVGPGDEVIVPAMTFAATAAAVVYCGATPVFADVLGPHDLALDPEEVAAKITPRPGKFPPASRGRRARPRRARARTGRPSRRASAPSAGP